MVEEKLKQFILSRYRSLLDFTTAIDMPYATLTSIFRRGIWNSSVTNVIKICQSLGISTDALVEGKIVPIDSDNEKGIDIEEAITMSKLNAKTLTLDGVPLSESELDTIYSAIDIGIGLVRKAR